MCCSPTYSHDDIKIMVLNLNDANVPARFEPILVALLKRREAAAAALVKAKEQAQELKAKLRPLKEENQELKLKRACLEEKLRLIGTQGRQDVQHYKVSAAAGGNTVKAQIDLEKECTF